MIQSPGVATMTPSNVSIRTDPPTDPPPGPPRRLASPPSALIQPTISPPFSSASCEASITTGFLRNLVIGFPFVGPSKWIPHQPKPDRLRGRAPPAPLALPVRRD